MGDAPPLGRSFETDDQEEPEAFMLRMTSLQKLVFDFGKKPASDGTSENEIVISRLLLANHNSKNPRRFTLIKKLRKALHYVLETVDDGPSTLEAMDRWMIVANTLLIIASEREFLEPGDYIQEAYLRNIFSTLSVCLFGLTLGVGNIQAAERLQLAGGMRPLFRRVDDLFTNLWMRKELLVPRDYLAIAEPTRLHKTIGQDSVFRRTMRLACIAYMLFMLSPERLYRHMPFSNHIHNVLMYCWAHTRDRRESIYGLEIIHAAFMGQYFQPNAPTNGADVSMATSHFFQELAIPPAVLTERFVSMLTDHDVHDEVLWKLLHSYHSMFVVFNGSEILNPRSEALHKELASGLCVAAERQVCKSWKAKLEHVFSPYLPGYETNAELRVIYMTWMNLSEVIRLPWADGGSRVVDVVASGGIAPKIVQLMAYTIQYHAKAGFFDLFKLMSVPLMLLTPLAGHVAQDARLDELFFTTAPPAPDLLDAVCSVWMPTLERLNALPERENDEKAEDEHIEKFVRHWARLAKAWRSYLETEESPDTAPEIPSDGGHRSAKWWKTAGCHWNQCLCRYTPTHTMRVCKGCSEVAYCGTACQTRDWSDGGHRDVCAGGNTSD